MCYLRIIAAPFIIFIILYESIFSNLFPFTLLEGTSFGNFLRDNFDAGNSFAIIIAGVIFLLAMLTDALDGYFARKYNVVSDKGKSLDPIADKILILGTFFAFWALGTPPDRAIMIYPLIVIALREVIISVMRSYVAKRKRMVGASVWGKIKTFVQTLSLLVIFTAEFVHYPIFGHAAMFVAAFVTLLSLFPYVFNFIKVLKEE